MTRQLIRERRFVEWVDGRAAGRGEFEPEHCRDCGINITPMLAGEVCSRWQWFMVHNEVWVETGLGPDDGCLCVACLESRLGRPLTAQDLTAYPINDPDGSDHRRLWALKYAAGRL